MPSLLGQSLFAVALLSITLVDAAPTSSVKNIEKSKSNSIRTQVGAGKALRRGKRQVLVEESDDVDDQNDEELLRQQLSELSDDQLLMLAHIVQAEIDKFQPQQQYNAYEVVELPEYNTMPVELMMRERRSPIDLDELQQLQDEEEGGDEEQPQILVVPEEALLEAMAESEEQDDLELRQRISEIASILNERASRSVRLL